MNENTSPPSGSPPNRAKSIAIRILTLCAAVAVLYLFQPKRVPVPDLSKPSALDAARKAFPQPPDLSAVRPKAAASAPEAPAAEPQPANATGHVRPSPWDTPAPG